MNTAQRFTASRRVGTVAAAVTLATAGLAIAAARPTTNIHLGRTSFGPYVAQRLQNGHHYAIYISLHDQRDKSRCYGTCLHTFQPVIAHGAVRAWNGVRRTLLGIINRGHGIKQVTYNHHPLYTSSIDTPGNAIEDGCKSSGSTWYVVDRNGKPDKRFQDLLCQSGY